MIACVMREGFIGMYTPLRSFLISDFVLQNTKKSFCQFYQNYLRHLCLKIFHFSDEWKVVSVAPQWFFLDILATASRLNTLYELETLYVQFSRHVGII